jgi:hypothetical protein
MPRPPTSKPNTLSDRPAASGYVASVDAPVEAPLPPGMMSEGEHYYLQSPPLQFTVVRHGGAGGPLWTGRISDGCYVLDGKIVEKSGGVAVQLSDPHEVLRVWGHTVRFPEEIGWASGPPLGKQQFGRAPSGKRVPINGQLAVKRNGRYVFGGDFCRDGYLVAGPQYDKLAAKQARWAAANPAQAALIILGRTLLFLLKVLWMIVKIVTVVYLLVEITKDINDVGQTISGPNSIANTNRNVNNYIKNH